MHLVAGTSGFSYREWRGSFYPADLPPARMLAFYAARFPAVEINSTFYRLPSTVMLERWGAQVPEDFRFAFKAPVAITHRRRLREADAETDEFIRRVSILGPRLGPLLFQLPPHFACDLPLLDEFLIRLPPLHVAFEFRHPSWLQDPVFELLRRHGRALCISDRDGGPAPAVVATARFGYARLRRSGYSDEELREWRRCLASQGWEKVYIFFRHEESGRGPALAEKLVAVESSVDAVGAG